MARSRAALAALVAASTASAAAKAPNIIFFLTDDQDVDMQSLAYMPALKANLVDAGATFTRMYAHVPVCCPSRSSLISGQYMHNNGCRGNSLGVNCSSPAFQKGPETRSYTVGLQAAGYRTSYAGKYLNDYGDPAAGGVAHLPPGWTNWQGLVGNSRYYDYTLSNNGVAEVHGSDYATDYLPMLVLNKTLAFLEANLGAAPVFAVLSTPSCHGPQTAAPQHQGAFPNARAPRNPSFNASVAATSWIQMTRGGYTFDDNAASFSDLVFRRRVQTLQTVDEMLVSVIELLREKGELDNTYIVYTADNGCVGGARLTGRAKGAHTAATAERSLRPPPHRTTRLARPALPPAQLPCGRVWPRVRQAAAVGHGHAPAAAHSRAGRRGGLEHGRARLDG